MKPNDISPDSLAQRLLGTDFLFRQELEKCGFKGQSMGVETGWMNYELYKKTYDRFGKEYSTFARDLLENGADSAFQYFINDAFVPVGNSIRSTSSSGLLAEAQETINEYYTSMTGSFHPEEAPVCAEFLMESDGKQSFSVSFAMRWEYGEEYASEKKIMDFSLEEFMDKEAFEAKFMESFNAPKEDDWPRP